MPTTAQYQGVIDALASIRLAESALDDLLATASGSAQAHTLNIIYSQLNGAVTLLIQAQMTADDAIFTQASASLKAQAAVLQASEQALQKIVADVGHAAKIIDYIAKAAALIAAL